MKPTDMNRDRAVRVTGVLMDNNGNAQHFEADVTLPDRPLPITLIPRFRNFVRRIVQAVIVAVVVGVVTYGIKVGF